MGKIKNILTVLLVVFLLTGLASASAQQTGKGSGSDGGGTSQSSIINLIQNKLHELSITIPCYAGYTYCYEQSYTYGSATAQAKVYISDPYIESNTLYVNAYFEGDKAYVYKGISDWSAVICSSTGCSGGTYLGAGGAYKVQIGDASTTYQPAPVFVTWDYNSYSSDWAWTWVGGGWFGNFNYDLRPQTVTVYLYIQGQGHFKIDGIDATQDYGTVTKGSTHSFEAVPASGYKFSKFISQSGVPTTNNPYTVRIDNDGSITAVFESTTTPAPTTPAPTTPAPTTPAPTTPVPTTPAPFWTTPVPTTPGPTIPIPTLPVRVAGFESIFTVLTLLALSVLISNRRKL